MKSLVCSPPYPNTSVLCYSEIKLCAKKKKKEAVGDCALKEDLFPIDEEDYSFSYLMTKEKWLDFIFTFFFCSFHAKIAFGLEFFDGWFKGCKEFDGARVGFHE